MDNFDTTLQKLATQVSQITNGSHNPYSQHSKEGKDRLNTKVVLVYGAPLVIIVALLFLVKPGFIIEEVVDSKGDNIVKISIRKLLIATLIFTGAVDGLIFMYLRKKKIKL
jgi:hypothetical protein